MVEEKTTEIDDGVQSNEEEENVEEVMETHTEGRLIWYKSATDELSASNELILEVVL